GPASRQADRINDEAPINAGALKQNGGTGSGAAVRKFETARLKRERNAAADHPEVVLRPVDHIPAEVIHPADRRSETHFNAATKLPNGFTFGIVVPFGDEVAVAVEQQNRTASTTENRPPPCKSGRCESRAWNRITKGKRSKGAADYALIASFDVKNFPTDSEAAATI